MFEIPPLVARLVLRPDHHNYVVAIALIAVVVMCWSPRSTLKSTKGMLEMQRLPPRDAQAPERVPRRPAKLNEEMMKLYQEHKVNPMASCLPLVAQMPVFIIMFRVLHGLTYAPNGGDALRRPDGVDARQRHKRPIGFVPRYLAINSELYKALVQQQTMMSFGLDLSKSAGALHRDRLRYGPDLRHPGDGPRPAVLRAAADGRLSRRRQPDDVARRSRS